MPSFTPLIGTIGVDRPVLVFTVGVAVFTTVVCGLVPAWRFSQTTHLGTRGTVAGHERTRHVLIALEVAISMVLLVGAGLLLRSLQELQRTQSGYEADGVTAMRIRGIGGGASAQSSALGAVYQQYLDRIVTLPGIESAAVASLALPSRAGTGFSVAGAETRRRRVAIWRATRSSVQGTFRSSAFRSRKDEPSRRRTSVDGHLSRS